MLNYSNEFWNIHIEISFNLISIFLLLNFWKWTRGVSIKDNFTKESFNSHLTKMGDGKNYSSIKNILATLKKHNLKKI